MQNSGSLRFQYLGAGVLLPSSLFVHFQTTFSLLIPNLPIPRRVNLLEGGCPPIPGCLEGAYPPHHHFDPLTQVPTYASAPQDWWKPSPVLIGIVLNSLIPPSAESLYWMVLHFFSSPWQDLKCVWGVGGLKTHFTIVHHCSQLFTNVHNLSPQQPPRQVVNHKWTLKPLQTQHRFETQKLKSFNSETCAGFCLQWQWDNLFLQSRWAALQSTCYRGGKPKPKRQNDKKTKTERQKDQK